MKFTSINRHDTSPFRESVVHHIFLTEYEIRMRGWCVCTRLWEWMCLLSHITRFLTHSLIHRSSGSFDFLHTQLRCFRTSYFTHIRRGIPVKIRNATVLSHANRQMHADSNVRGSCEREHLFVCYSPLLLDAFDALQFAAR